MTSDLEFQIHRMHLLNQIHFMVRLWNVKLNRSDRQLGMFSKRVKCLGEAFSYLKNIKQSKTELATVRVEFFSEVLGGISHVVDINDDTQLVSLVLTYG